MTTIRNLISGSLRLINVVQANEAATADDMDISLSALNAMLDSWSTERLSVFLVDAYYFPLVADQKEYTLGPGGDWDIADRPMNILSASVSVGGALTYVVDHYEINQNPDLLDIPMEKLTPMQYASISLKDQQSTYPTKYYDNCNSPLRKISVWPVPTVEYPVTLWLWQPLTDYDNLDEELIFPKGYERAIRFNLAVELAAEFGKSISPDVINVAVTSKASIKRLNSKGVIMRGDIALVGNAGIYNYNLSTTVPN